LYMRQAEAERYLRTSTHTRRRTPLPLFVSVLHTQSLWRAPIRTFTHALTHLCNSFTHICTHAAVVPVLQIQVFTRDVIVTDEVSGGLPGLAGWKLLDLVDLEYAHTHTHTRAHAHVYKGDREIERGCVCVEVNTHTYTYTHRHRQQTQAQFLALPAPRLPLTRALTVLYMTGGGGRQPYDGWGDCTGGHGRLPRAGPERRRAHRASDRDAGEAGRAGRHCIRPP
jgi:hypothetical protein